MRFIGISRIIASTTVEGEMMEGLKYPLLKAIENLDKILDIDLSMIWLDCHRSLLSPDDSRFATPDWISYRLSRSLLNIHRVSMRSGWLELNRKIVIGNPPVVKAIAQGAAFLHTGLLSISMRNESFPV